MKLKGLDHVAIAVADIEQSAAWYEQVLGFEKQHQGKWGGVPTFVGKGEMGIALFPKKRKESAGTGSILHFAFGARREDFLAAQRELKSQGIAFHFEDHQIAHSIYFSDPDGHKVEITTYEVE